VGFLIKNGTIFNMRKIQFLKPKEINKLQKEAGVYFFYGKEKKPIYIGKANNLKERVKNHFQQSTYKDNFFINEVKKIGYITLKSEIEALILESELIKKYQPKFNVIFRDDKNYFYVGITKEDWPRIFITHQPQKNSKFQNPNSKIDYIGPFVGGTALKETLKILRKIFLYRSCKTLPKKPCLWYELNRCPAPCLIVKESKENQELQKQAEQRKKEYQRSIENLKMVLEGKKENLLSRLEKEMKEYAKNQEFEKAAKVRDQIESLKEVFSHKFLFYSKPTEKNQEKENIGKLLQKTLLLPKVPQRIEGYDISHLKGKNMVGSMVVFKLSRIKVSSNFSQKCGCEYKPDKKEYRLFKIKTVEGQNDTACLKEVIKRRLSHSEWTFPDLIYVDGGKGQFNAAKSVIESQNLKIPIISLAKKKNILYTSILEKPLLLDKLPKKIKITILYLRDESHRFAISYHKKLRAYEFTNSDANLRI